MWNSEVKYVDVAMRECEKQQLVKMKMNELSLTWPIHNSYQRTKKIVQILVLSGFFFCDVFDEN